ncbi:L,D-transpeptidase [Ectobacillus polymachus]|uniref:L,D-transpeptidase n=1 Tax=Ectobacillus polymachus TaxID=1508806 RepID=UPI003A8521FC
MTKLLSIMLVIALSPIWPLGDNPRVGDPYIIINKQSNKLAYIDKGKIQAIIPVATGKTDELTPEGEFDVVSKLVNPYYIKKDIPGGSPNNPLGTRWIGFNARGTNGSKYGIHGTNQPNSIGKYISSGCIRMLNQNIEYLYSHIPIGTKVYILNSMQTFEEIARAKGAIPKK